MWDENGHQYLIDFLPLPQRIYIHAGKTSDVNVPEKSLTHRWIMERLTVDQQSEYLKSTLTRGAIIGEATLTNCFKASSSPWAEPGMYHFLLADPVLYKEPIPYAGRLGFFEVTL
jgi:hypothetical protein